MWRRLISPLILVFVLFAGEAMAGLLADVSACRADTNFTQCIERANFSKEPEQAYWVAKCRVKIGDARQQCYLDTLSQFGYIFYTDKELAELADREKAKYQEKERLRKEFEERNRQREAELQRLPDYTAQSISRVASGLPAPPKATTYSTARTQTSASSDEDQDPTHDEKYCLSLSAEKALIKEKRSYRGQLEYDPGFLYSIRNGCRKTFRSLKIEITARDWSDTTIPNLKRTIILNIDKFAELKEKGEFLKSSMTKAEYDAIRSVTITLHKW